MNGEPSNEALLADIERDEAWLAEVLAAHPTPACASLEAVKHRVRIAVLEEGVDVESVPELPAASLDRIKLAVRAELAAQESVQDAAVEPQWQNWRIAAMSLAAAAVLVFAFLPFGSVEGPPPVPADQGFEDFVAIVAAVTADDDATLTAFEAALEEVESSWASSTEDWFTDEVDDLESDIDDLLNDSAELLDV